MSFHVCYLGVGILFILNTSAWAHFRESRIFEDAIQEAKDNLEVEDYGERHHGYEDHHQRKSAKHTPLTQKIGYQSNVNLEAYKILLQKPGWAKANGLKFLHKRLPQICKREIKICLPSKYRSIDGTCNNAQNPFWGASFTAFERLLPSAYSDGYNEQRGGKVSTLTNARLISSTVHYDQIIADAVLTNMVGQFGQFLDHDMTLTPDGDKRCCTTEKSGMDCWPIQIPATDAFYSQRHQTCLEFTRSSPYCFPRIEHNALLEREQMNILTAYVDASNVYGSEETRASQLRLHKNGKLRMNSKYPNLLPTVDEVRKATREKIEFMGTFYAGDERVNEMPALAVIHTLFAREHNRIAEKIKEKFPSWRDDKIYEETRRILIAEMQNIVYAEYLPVVLGTETMGKYNLALGISDGQYFTTYNSSMDATVVHSFATAAYRFGHTLINGIIRLMKNFEQIGEYRLRDNFFKDGQIFGPTGNGDGYNYILEGLTTQPAQKYDNFVTEDLGRFLLREDKHDFGQDLIARNLQRGRDHGIPPYNDFRIFCGFPPLPSNFNEIPKWPHFTNGTWSQFAKLYKNPKEIDLFTGGLTEERSPGALTGPTFNCIKAKQFQRTKFGDSHFFTHANTPGSFTETQLKHLRKRKFSDIICENSDLKEVPIDVFKMVPAAPTTSTNRHMFCNETKSPAERVLLDLTILFP